MSTKTITGWDYVSAGDVREGDVIDLTAYLSEKSPETSVLWVDSITYSSDLYGVGTVIFNGHTSFGRGRRLYVLKEITR